MLYSSEWLTCSSEWFTYTVSLFGCSPYKLVNDPDDDRDTAVETCR